MGIRDIGKIRHYLAEDTTKHLVIALVISKLDSNTALLYKVNKGLYDKLQLVKNNAARLIATKRKCYSITHIRKELHWLPIEFRIKYKIYLLTFKCIHNSAPSYLQSLLQPYEPNRRLRPACKGYLNETKTRTVAGDRAFSNAAPTLWKQLPEKIRDINNIEHFKTELKTHLFNLAYDTK